MKQANCLLVDGTCWTNEEMITQNLGTKKALEMGHLPQTGDSGMINILETMNRWFLILCAYMIRI